MTATIHQFHTVSPIGHFLRLGHTGHRKLEDLHASGRLGFDRVVADAAYVDTQMELLDSLRSSATELILDTRMAELSTPGGYQSSARGLDWARSDRPYAADDLDRVQRKEVADRIASFVIENCFDVVMAPTHMLAGPNDPWSKVDSQLCNELRLSLDRLGGQSVAIDYPLIVTYQVLLDGAARKSLVGAIEDLPFDNLWLRIANFGSDKSAAGLRKYINALRDFHEIEKPLVADGVGGLPALSVVAFGAAGGFCHGVAQKERFYPRDWWKPRSSGSGGGTKRRVYFPKLDMYLDEQQSRTLLGIRNAKPLLGCPRHGVLPRRLGRHDPESQGPLP